MQLKIAANYIKKKFNLACIEEECLPIKDVLLLSCDKEYLRRVLRNFTKADRQEFVDRLELGKVERYVYSCYYNFYMQKQKGKDVQEINATLIKSYIKLYFKNYHFSKKTGSMILKMRQKAYYSAFRKNK